ncbi:MAG: porin family protein [Bacteroidota bacterium]
MKIVRIIITFIQVALLASSLLAQNVNIGLRTGVTHYTISNELTSDDANYMTGLLFAVPIEFKISKGFSIQPELQYIQKGVSFDLQDDDDREVKFTGRSNYLELPVLFKGNLVKQNFGLHIYAGPAIGYGLNQKGILTPASGDKVKEKIEWIDEGAVQDQRWDFSATGGIGASFNAGVGTIVVDARYSYDFNDNTKFETNEPTDWEESKNHGFNLSVGYMIPLGAR